MSSERVTGRSVELVEPKTSTGVLAESDPQEGPRLGELAAALDAWERQQPSPPAADADGGDEARRDEWEQLRHAGQRAVDAGDRRNNLALQDADHPSAPSDPSPRSGGGEVGRPAVPRESLSWLEGADEWPSLMAWDAELGATGRQEDASSAASAVAAAAAAASVDDEDDLDADQDAGLPADAPGLNPALQPNQPLSPATETAETGSTPAPDAANATLSPAAAAIDPPRPIAAPARSVPITFPPDAGRLIDLPKLGATEINELIDRVSLKLEAERGYKAASASLVRQLPPVPEGVSVQRTLSRDDGPEGVRIVRLGSRRYLSQLPQVWVWAVIVPPAPTAVEPENLNVPTVRPAAPNTELLESMQGEVQTTIDGINVMRESIVPSDLGKRIIQLSYVDPSAAISMLKGLGVTAIGDVNGVPSPIPFAQLPIVVQTPAPSKEQIGLVGTTGNTRGEFGQSTTPTEAVQLPEIVNTSPTSQLMVLFHPAYPEQFSEVRALIDDIVDRPARQIFVEGMVLEISETGLEDLGIEWQFREGPFNWIAGTLDPGGVADTLLFDYVEGRDFSRDWSAQLRALIRDGKAEILSRPSVLTLNNRQATIRVGQDIPIATSQEGFASNTNKISFNFKYLATGILLNVRPRIVEDGSEVGMLVDAVVSNVVPGADLEIRSNDGELLASAPTVSTRRVQTYSRIRNNTPFIIGGLVSRDYSTILDKVPVLGDLPLVGVAFRAERTQTLKREVIIVLTPYVLPDNQNIARSLPKDEDVFDSIGNELFRDAYRIRSEDVFDLSFLLENRRLLAYKDIAEALIRENFLLAGVDPFVEFARDRVPGEDVLVHRMIYEVIKRLDASGIIDPERIIFFESSEGVAGYNVSFISRVLTRLGGGEDYNSFFANNQGKALALIYHHDRQSMNAERMASEPIPELALIDCPDEATWQRLLWELNQPTADGRERSTILIRNEGDYRRLRRSLLLKKVIDLNGGETEVSLENFRVGKLILMPEIKPGQANVIDVEVARLFYHTELYYAAALERIEDACRGIDAFIQSPDIRAMLNGMFIPTPVQQVEEQTPAFIDREDVTTMP
ncbi:MAG: hypothetical protein ACOC0P_00900 [Planctomycetota bacterium]